MAARILALAIIGGGIYLLLQPKPKDPLSEVLHNSVGMPREEQSWLKPTGIPTTPNGFIIMPPVARHVDNY